MSDPKEAVAAWQGMGVPWQVYLVLPTGEAPALIDGALQGKVPSSNSGADRGRITRLLVSSGQLAVDDSPEMLSHIEYAETVLADLLVEEAGVVGSSLSDGSTRRGDGHSWRATTQ